MSEMCISKLSVYIVLFFSLIGMLPFDPFGDLYTISNCYAFQNAGDFASVAFMVLKNRCPDTGQLTINDVNKYLDNVAVSSAARKKG